MRTLIAAMLLASASTAGLAQSAQPPVLTSAHFEQVALTVTDINVTRTFYRDCLAFG